MTLPGGCVTMAEVRGTVDVMYDLRAARGVMVAMESWGAVPLPHGAFAAWGET